MVHMKRKGKTLNEGLAVYRSSIRAVLAGKAQQTQSAQVGAAGFFVEWADAIRVIPRGCPGGAT